MKLRIILIAFFLAPTLAMAEAQTACQRMRGEMQTLHHNLNKMFGLKVELELVRSTSQVDPQILDDKDYVDIDVANAFQINKIQMPEPCLLAGDRKVDHEAFLLIYAHEYAHHILDQGKDHCWQVASGPGDIWQRDDVDKTRLMNITIMGHLNVDILALKLINHFNIDQRKAVKQMAKVFAGEDFNTHRLNYMNAIVPTSLAHGHDFVGGHYLTNFDVLKKAMEKHHPHSTLIKDMEPHLYEKDGCYLYKNEIKDEAVKLYEHLRQPRSQPQTPVDRKSYQ